MAESMLYLFDITGGIDGAPCVARLRQGPESEKVRREDGTGFDTVPIPPIDPSTHIGREAVGVESDQFQDKRTQELRLNADGVTIDVVAGHSEEEEARVSNIRRVIAEPLLDAIGRCVVAIVKTPGVAGSVPPEIRRLADQIESLLRVSDVTDGPDLDVASGKVDEVEAINDSRPARPGRGQGGGGG